jgi:hypothetical protein
MYFNSKLLELIIQIYGSFVATLFGVYLSLYFSKKQDRQNTAEKIQQTMLGSLKVIWSELDINEEILRNLNDGLKNMPRNITKLYEQQSYLIEHVKALKYKAFYSTMSSGAINIISNHPDIFNDLQQAYYNLEMTQNGLNLTNQAYKDLIDLKFAEQNPELVAAAFSMLYQERLKVDRTIAMIVKAKKSTSKYLKSKGVIFTIEEK